MRIIAGSHKGRKLLSCKGLELRPTSGRVREALFSILERHIVGSLFLDLYAGTGAVGLEALSRGAQRVVFVESHPDSLCLLHANLQRCHFPLQVDIQACSVAEFFRRSVTPSAVFDIVFADPPYEEDSTNLLPLLGQNAMIGNDTIVLLEHPTKHSIPSQVGRLSRVRYYRYGDTSLSKFALMRSH
jgi:16S rRNA (guanine966-N2)-methyltransferase